MRLNSKVEQMNKPYLPLASRELSMESGIALTSILLLMVHKSEYLADRYKFKSHITIALLTWFVKAFLRIESSIPLSISFSPRNMLPLNLSMQEIGSIGKILVLLLSSKNCSGFTLSLTVSTVVSKFRHKNHVSIPALLYDLLVLFAVASAYSSELPLLRWKGNQFLAPTAILIMRGLAIPLAFFIHIQDIPDVDGDRENGIQTLTVSLGKEKVYWLCISMLLIGYGSAMVVGASSSSITNKLVTVLGHGALASFISLAPGSFC